MRIGTCLRTVPMPGGGIDEILEQARVADRQGFASVWMSDHLMATRGEPGADGPPDALTLMVAVAAVTERVQLGWIMLNPSFRNPAVLAKMLATLDQISHGRVICSLGAGWFADEYAAYDLEFIEARDERQAYLDEVIELFRELWTRPAPDTVSFDGQYVQVRDLAFSPKPVQDPHPPIWLGGDSDATVATVKKLADGWVMGRPSSEALLPSRLEADDWPSRPITVAKVTPIAVAEQAKDVPAESERIYAGLLPIMGEALGSLEDFRRDAVVGTAEECLQRLHQGVNALIDHHIFLSIDAAHEQAVAELLLPAIDQSPVA